MVGRPGEANERATSQRSGLCREASRVPYRPLPNERAAPETASATIEKQKPVEGRSMQDVARSAVREYIDRTSRRELLDDVLDQELPRYAEALRRLGE